MFFAFALSIDKDVIQVYYHKNVELFCQNLIDINLKYGWYVSQSKRHNLVLKVAIVGLESCLPFVFFSNSHLMVGISQIKLGKPLSPT